MTDGNDSASQEQTVPSSVGSSKQKCTASNLEKLLKSQDYKCAYTGVELAPETCEIDHFHPISKGGGHDMSNLRWVLNEVNRMKGTLDFQRFHHLCSLVAAKPIENQPSV